MRVIVFGATGMIGQGVLRECLLDRDVEVVLAIGRSATGRRHEKLHELVQEDLSDFSALKSQLTGYDACFFCLGVSSAGMTEEAYHRVTHDLTLAAANALVARNAGMTFVYVSGAGTDSSERGRRMWARVKGKTENALLALPFERKVMFRPALIRPLHGITSRTRTYRILYALLGPLDPLWRALGPRYVTTTEQLGRAMLAVAKRGAPKPVLENADIEAIGSAASAPTL